ncbi:hypothetical protein Bxe_C0466 [Paraburkholderia xenovorans LB400]|uniref:Uncharacterized protein n=1 Tax=Paraburkholderia xenovorans (strain LB400) TaxID=266265 RepID=Q13HR9_PARXL|nr:hypothetical protein Bxe_C0466 [Paraburkholderia xenovorans LB400]
MNSASRERNPPFTNATGTPNSSDLRAVRHFRTDGIFACVTPESTNLPSSGHLILWRFRADWRSASRDEAYSWLSVAKRERAKRYPNRAAAKRYLVGRATLRQILSRMLDCGPGTVVLGDGADG